MGRQFFGEKDSEIRFLRSFNAQLQHQLSKRIEDVAKMERLLEQKTLHLNQREFELLKKTRALANMDKGQANTQALKENNVIKRLKQEKRALQVKLLRQTPSYSNRLTRETAMHNKAAVSMNMKIRALKTLLDWQHATIIHVAVPQGS